MSTKTDNPLYLTKCSVLFHVPNGRWATTHSARPKLMSNAPALEDFLQEKCNIVTSDLVLGLKKALTTILNV